MPKRSASATWEGNLKEGQGHLALGSGAFAGKYSFGTRFEGAAGTNPEELLGAAHAGCFSMALAAGLGRAGHEPTRIDTTAVVHLDKLESGMTITRIVLTTTGLVPGLAEAEFVRFAEETKKTCIVSRALAAVEMEVNASLATSVG
jgi:lipoyl-dependent peroxiredoxin